MQSLLSPTTVAVAIVAIYLLSSIKILRQYERGVIFRLGRVLPRPKGTGIVLASRPHGAISLRIDTLEVPTQDIVTHDNMTVK
jgi:regulator of protease activity HflC (stomatin/prohibitin superfamily)